MFKFFFWIALIGAAVVTAAQVIPVQYNNMKVENVFEGAVSNLNTSSTDKIASRLPSLLRSQSVDIKALPEEFFEHLSITKDGNKLTISSKYHVVLWLLGEPTSVDINSDYQASELEMMDKIRLKARLDFDFSPMRVTP